MSVELKSFIDAALKEVKAGATTGQVAQDLKVEFDLAVKPNANDPKMIDVDESPQSTALKLKFELVVPIRP